MYTDLSRCDHLFNAPNSPHNLWKTIELSEFHCVPGNIHRARIKRRRLDVTRLSAIDDTTWLRKCGYRGKNSVKQESSFEITMAKQLLIVPSREDYGYIEWPDCLGRNRINDASMIGMTKLRRQIIGNIGSKAARSTLDSLLIKFTGG